MWWSTSATISTPASSVADSVFDGHASGDLISRIMEDVIVVERVIIEGGEIGVTSLLSLPTVAIILFAKNAQLAAAAIAPLPILAAGALWYSPRAYSLYRAHRHAGATLNAVVADNLQGIRQVKAFGQEDRERRRFAVYADALRRRVLAVINLWSIYAPAMNFVGALGTVAVFWVGGPLVAAGKISLGELMSFVFYLPLIYEPAKQLNRLNQMIQGARASCGRGSMKSWTSLPKGAPRRARSNSHTLCAATSATTT